MESTTKTKSGMIDTLSFEENENVKRANDAVSLTFRKYFLEFNISGYTSGFDSDTKDVLFFFPLEDLRKIPYERKGTYFDDVKRNWHNAGFEVIEEKEISGYEYFHVGFSALFFRLKSTLPK